MDKHDSPCNTPHLAESDLQQHFITALSQMLKDRSSLLEDGRMIQQKNRYRNRHNCINYGICYGASVLIGLFEKCARTNAFSVLDIFKFNPHPYRMRLKFEGLSHALPNSPPDCLVPSLRSGRAFESHLEH